MSHAAHRYLASKGRAGVIKLEPNPPTGEAHHPQPPRVPFTLYIVPPSASVCAALGAAWDARRDTHAPLVLALVVPQGELPPPTAAPPQHHPPPPPHPPPWAR